MTSPFRPTNPFAEEPESQAVPAPTYRATNPFAEEEQQAKQESARVRALVNGVTHSPEQATEAITLSRQTGVPADVALRNLDPLRKMQSVEEFDADTFVRQNPMTSRWLQADPINPAIARDDLENLGGFEQLVGRWRMPSASDVLAGLAGGPTAGGRIFQQVQRGRVQAAYGVGQAGIELTELYGTALAAERRTPEFQAKAEALRAQQEVAIPEADDFLERSLVSVARGFAPSMAYVAGEAIEGFVGGYAGGAALGALAGPGALATGAVGGAAGARIKGYNAYRILTTGELNQRLDSARDAYGNPIPDDVKDAVALTGGAGLALLGMYGFDKAVGLVAGASRRIAAQAVGNATATALTSATGRRVALEVGKTVLGTTVLETAQEVTEQAGLIAGESVARMIAGGGLDAGDFGPVENVTAELLETAIETAYGAWILGGVGGVSAGVLGYQRINQAKQDGAVIETLAEQAGMSKLRQRDPAKYEELVRLQTPESLERVGIDAERLTVLLQEQSVPLAQFAQVAGITEQDVAEALARGGDVYIPTPNLLARLVGTPVFDAMKMDLRIRPDGLTQREADEQAQTLEADQKAVEAEVQAIIKSGTTDASGQRVIDDITAQITAAAAQAPKAQRFTPENIEATARGIAAFFITTAQRTGQDAFALYQSRNYRIVGRETAEPLYDALVEAQKLEKSGKNPERLATLRGTIAALRGTLPAAEVQRMEQAAFHGSPYVFEKFSLSKIGTGEGAQAFGWGLYFAENEGVAQGYQATLSKPRLFLDGVEQTGLNAERRDILKDIALNGYDVVVERNKRTREVFVAEFGEGQPLVNSIDRTLRLVQEFEGKSVRAEDIGALYRVDIPDEAVARFLDWDKPLSEQAPEVREALEAAGVDTTAPVYLVEPSDDGQFDVLHPGKWVVETFATEAEATAYAQEQSAEFAAEEWTGNLKYNQLAHSLGSQQAASEWLLSKGIPGIKYLDAGSRADGDGTRNLVVFDENLVTITHRNGDPVTAQERTDFLAQEAMGSAVSTRFPTAMKATEDPLRSLLSIGLAEMQMDPKAFAKNTAAVAQYPNMRVVENETPEQTAERFIQHVSDNLLWLHDQVDEATRQRSKLWYDGARRIAERWSGEYDLTVEQVSGVMAALSPQKDWYQNVSLARRVLDTMSKQAKFRWTPEMTTTAARLNAEGKPLLDPEYVTLIKGKVLGQLQDAREIAWFVRVYDETYNDRQFPTITPEGGEAGPVLTAKGNNAKVAWGSYNEIAKAVAIALEPSLANISMNLGEAHKVRNFYNNIVDPGSPRGEVTIDTHAVAAGLLRPLSGKSIEVKHNLQGGLGASNSSIFGVVGTYGLFAEAYRRAAAARDVLPREMQSITWEAIRGLFPAEFKDAKNVEAVDAVWQRYRDGTLTLDAVRTEVAGLAGGIANPTWYGSDAGLDAGLEPSVDARGIPQGVGAVGTRGPRVRGDVATTVPKQRPGIGGGFARARESVRAGLSLDFLAQAPALPETLEVDGVSRPTRNSTGQPIHPTEEGVRNFWRWFGNSKVVDEQGRPLVVYHGTNKDFTEFRMSSRGSLGAGIYTSPISSFAEEYGGGEGGRVLTLYARMKNPLILTGEISRDPMIEALQKLGIAPNKADAIVEKAYESSGYIGKQVMTRAQNEGYDGILQSRAMNGVEQLAEVLVWNNTNLKSADANSGEFGPTANILRQGAGRPNAFIMQGVSQKTIALMNGADLSSLLHEFSHDWLEILGDLSQGSNVTEQTQADYAAILKYLGVESRDQIGVPEQEKFARSFERWLATAEAPSRGLARAFVRFKSWMQRIYRMAQDMLVPVDPAIADVFARMLATDEELAQVRGEIGAEPMFTDAESAGKTPQEMADYQRKVELRTAEESGALLSALLFERSEEAKKIRREREKEIRAEVEAEVAERPVYQVVRDLTANAKLDLTDLQAQFGDAIKASLPRGITASEGDMVPVDVVALRYGFRDGTAVVAALQEAKRNTEKQEVNRIVRERMAQEFPDPMERSDVMRMEAMKAAHRSETDDVLLDELRTLSRSAGIRPPNVQAVKNVARQMLGKEQVKNIRPIVYQNAEATAARKAGEAWRSGDNAKAAFHKRQQLLNHILYREARSALADAEKVRTFARRMEGTAAQARLGKAGASYQEAMNGLLDAYEFRNLSRPQMAEKEKLRAQVAAWAAEVEAAYTVETDDGKVALIQPSIDEAVLASPMNYRDLTVNTLDGVYAAMKQVYHTASSLDKELRKAKAMLFNERVELLVETAEKNWTPDAPHFIQSQGLMDKMAEDVDAKHGEMIKVEMLARLLDGDKPNGPWQEALTNYASESQAEFNRDMEAFTIRYKAAMDRIPKDRIKGFFSELVTVPGVAGVGTANPRITGQQVFHLLLNYGNESSRAAVNAGEFANNYRPYTDANVRKLVALLTPNEMQAAQEIWDAVSMFWPQMAELNREMTGITPEKVKASPVTLTAADGSEVTLKGGYFPLKYDTRFSAKAYQQEQSRAEATAEGLVPFLGSATSTTERGHLEQRREANGRIVDLSPEVVARHMSAAVYDLTHRRMVYDVQKLVLDPRIADIVQRTAGKGAYRKALLPWARRLAGEKGPPQTWVAKMALRARAGASTMGLGFRATTVLLQYLGVGQTIALIGPKYTARGFREIQKYGKGAFEAADALAAEIAYRQLSFNRDLSEMARNMKANGTWKGWHEVAFAGIAFMDRQVSVAAFWGGYYKWLDANPTDVAGAVQAGEQAVRLSQGANTAKDLAQLMASNDPLTRTLTSFFSNGSVLYQLFWRASRQAKGKGTKAAFLTSILGAWIVPAVIEPLMRGSSPDDDEDLEDQIAWWFWQITTYPMQALPLVRDFARMMEPGSKFNKDFVPPFLRPFTELGKSALAVLDIAGDGELDAADIKQFVRTLGYWSNLPLDAPWGMSERLYQWMTGEVLPDNVFQGWRFVLTNAPPN